MTTDDVAKQFTKFYYDMFDTDRSQLAALYREGSMLTFEKDQILGSNNIVGKLVSLPFSRVKHIINTTDAQPSIIPGSLIVSVTGLLNIDGDNPLNFSQTFQLVLDNGTYYVHNDIFRFNFG